MASVFLPFENGTLVKNLPRVCVSCGAPATQSDKVTFWRNEREATIRVPLCNRHPLMGWFWPVLIVGFLILVAFMGVSALVDGFVPRIVLIIPFNLIISVWMVANFYLAYTEVGCGSIDSRGVRLTRVSRHFVRAVAQHEEERGRQQTAWPPVPGDPPAEEKDRKARRRKRLRSSGPINRLALCRQLAIIGGISLGVFVLITIRHVLPPEGSTPQQPEANKQPEPPQQPPVAKQPEKPPEPPPPNVPPSAADFPGLLAYWPFQDDNPTERVADQANKGNDGKAVGAVQAEGIRGKALSFGKDAFFDYGAKPGLDFPANGAFTMAFWVKTTSASGLLISQRHSKDVGSLIETFVAGGRFQVHVRRDTLPWLPEVVISKSLINDGRWRHCAFLRSGETVEIYVDGSQEANVLDKHAAGPITTDLRAVAQEGCWVLGKKGPERGFTGAVDEFCIFGRALKSEEIKALAGR